MPYGWLHSGKEKLQFTPFSGGPKPGCSDGRCTGPIESHNFFVLGPILVKFHIRTRLIESFRTSWCGQEKLHFTPFHTLRQLNRDEARFHHLEGCRVSSEVPADTCTQVLGGWQNLDTVRAAV